MITTIAPPVANFTVRRTAENQRFALSRASHEMREYRNDGIDDKPKTPDGLRFTVAGNVFWNRNCADHLSLFLLRNFYIELRPLPKDADNRRKEIGRRYYLAAEIIYESVLFDMRDCLPEGCEPETDFQQQAKAVSELFCKAFVFEFLPRYEKISTPNFTCAEVINFISDQPLH